MNEVSEAGAKAKGKGNKAAKKAAGGAEAKGTPSVEGQISRMMVRAMWVQEWSAANPEAKGEARKAAWKEARSTAMEKNLKAYRRALASLAKSGVTMTLSESAAKKTGDEDDAEE